MTTNETVIQTLIRMYQIDLSAYDEDFLANILQQRMNDTRCLNPSYYLGLLQHNPVEADALQNALKVAYSEFFRNPLTFTVLEKIVLPDIIAEKRKAKKQEIRIWTMASAAGQETYSIAIVLRELMDLLKINDLSFRIFATDHDQQLIDNARKGIFSLQSLAKVSTGILNKWFVKEGDLYRIDSKLKNNIDFSVFDLFDTSCTCPTASIFGDFDLIFCSNLLFYYKEEFRAQILNKARHCLSQGGCIITGETERDMLPSSNYRELYPQSAIFSLQRKQ